MKPTLDQARKVLELISQSGRTDEWVQKHLVGSGAISDLLAVDNLRDMNRDERRRFLGLKPLRRSLLEPLGTITIAATPELVASERFVVGGKIEYIDDNFAWFYGKTEKRASKTKLRYAELICSELDELDASILKGLGSLAETTLAQIFALIEQQENGEAGVLLNNGWANIFYVKDARGTLRAVFVYWGECGWRVCVRFVSASSRCGGGCRVFFRNS